MTKKALHSLLLVTLTVLLFITTMPINTAAYKTVITPGGSVSSILEYGNTIDEFIVSGMTTSDYWGIRLTARVTGTTNYEVWLAEEEPNYVIPGLWDNQYTVEFHPSTQNANTRITADGFVYESEVVKYAIGEYRYAVTIPEYAWEDMPLDTAIWYTLELYQGEAPATASSSTSAPAAPITQTPSTTAPSSITPPASGGLSDWAAEQVNQGIGAGLVPPRLQSDYSKAATRAEFAALAVALYEKEFGVIQFSREEWTFNDTNDSNVSKAAYLGIVQGVGGGRFDPDAPLTREQAATMLARLSDALGQPFPMRAATFSDNGSIADWALTAVGRVQAAGIMQGVGDDRFDPSGSYTREQSIVTVVRSYDVVSTTTVRSNNAVSGTIALGEYVSNRDGQPKAYIEILSNNRFVINYVTGSETEKAEGTYTVANNIVTFTVSTSWQNPDTLRFDHDQPRGKLTYNEDFNIGTTEKGHEFIYNLVKASEDIDNDGGTDRDKGGTGGGTDKTGGRGGTDDDGTGSDNGGPNGDKKPTEKERVIITKIIQEKFPMFTGTRTVMRSGGEDYNALVALSESRIDFNGQATAAELRQAAQYSVDYMLSTPAFGDTTPASLKLIWDGYDMLVLRAEAGETYSSEIITIRNDPHLEFVANVTTPIREETFKEDQWGIRPEDFVLFGINGIVHSDDSQDSSEIKLYVGYNSVTGKITLTGELLRKTRYTQTTSDYFELESEETYFHYFN